MSKTPKAVQKRRKPVECVFRKGFVTEQVDPVVDQIWKASFGGKTPFGDLRNMWRRHHCRTLNPYGDSEENCPYDEKQCARAFFDAVKEVTVVHRMGHVSKPVGYFIRVAKTTAALRADEAVSRRAQAAMVRRTSVRHSPPPPTQPRPDARAVGGAVRGGARQGSDGGAANTGRPGPLPTPEEDRSPAGVPGVGDGPVSLGDLFRGMAARPREDRADDGEKGARPRGLPGEPVRDA